jgi:anti-anti-sigma factor
MILILVILSLLQLLAGGIPLLGITYFSQQNTVREAQRQAAEKLALSIDTYLQGALDRLEHFVQDHDREVLLRGQESLELPAMMDSLLERGDFLEIWILDPDGQEIFQRSLRYFVFPEQYGSRANSPEFQAIMSGEPWYISPIHIPQHPTLIMFTTTTIAMPINSPDGTRGVLLAEVNTPRIQEIISETPLGEEAYAYLVDKEGVLRVHWEDARVALKQRNLADEGIPAVQAFQDNRQETTTYRGVNQEIAGRVLGTWAPMRLTDWGVVVEQPVSEAFRGLWRIIIVFVVLLVVSVLVAAGIGTLLARRLLKPVETLQEGAYQLGHGNLGHRIQVRTQDEFGVLAATFNEMADQVQTTHEAIEAQVEARTRELSQAYDQLREQSTEQKRLLETIRDMSTPVIPVIEGVVVMPLIGSLDSERADMVTEALLDGIEANRARVAILDITGVPVVDTAVASALLQAMDAATLLGVKPVLVGITPEVAQTIVHLGVDLSQITTRNTLQGGVEYALKQLTRPPSHAR